MVAKKTATASLNQPIKIKQKYHKILEPYKVVFKCAVFFSSSVTPLLLYRGVAPSLLGVPFLFIGWVFIRRTKVWFHLDCENPTNACIEVLQKKSQIIVVGHYCWLFLLFSGKILVIRTWMFWLTLTLSSGRNTGVSDNSWIFKNNQFTIKQHFLSLS